MRKKLLLVDVLSRELAELSKEQSNMHIFYEILDLLGKVYDIISHVICFEN